MSSTKRSFFETYPHEYDALTNARTRVKPHRLEVEAIIDRFHPASVLDAGCATGLTARLFAEKGIRTVGLDRVKAMLEDARRSSRHDKRLLSFRYGHFEKLPKNMTGKFDLIVCLANALGGVGTMANLRKSLKNFHSVLTPGGNIVIQMLNYSAIKEGEIMPIRATSKGKIIYERFSERRDRRLYVYITRLDTGSKPPKYEIFRHEMDNFSPSEVTSTLKQTGFKRIVRYGDLLFSKKFTRTSRDLVITARKPE